MCRWGGGWGEMFGDDDENGGGGGGIECVCGECDHAWGTYVWVLHAVEQVIRDVSGPIACHLSSTDGSLALLPHPLHRKAFSLSLTLFTPWEPRPCVWTAQTEAVERATLRLPLYHPRNASARIVLYMYIYAYVQIYVYV